MLPFKWWRRGYRVEVNRIFWATRFDWQIIMSSWSLACWSKQVGKEILAAIFMRGGTKFDQTQRENFRWLFINVRFFRGEFRCCQEAMEIPWRHLKPWRTKWSPSVLRGSAVVSLHFTHARWYRNQSNWSEVSVVPGSPLFSVLHGGPNGPNSSEVKKNLVIQTMTVCPAHRTETFVSVSPSKARRGDFNTGRR